MKYIYTLFIIAIAFSSVGGEPNQNQMDSIKAVVVKAAVDSVQAKAQEEANTIHQEIVRQRNEVLFVVAGIAVILGITAVFLILQKRRTDKQLRQKNTIIEKTNANLKSAQAHLAELEKVVFRGRLTDVITQEVQDALKIELTGVRNEVIITLAEKVLTIDLVSEIVRIQIGPEMTVKNIFDLIQKTLQKYESLPIKEKRKVRLPGRFDFR